MKIEKLLLVLFSAILLTSCGQNISKKTELISGVDSVSYAIGADIANFLDMNSFHKINYLACVNGLSDVLNHDSLKFNEDSLKLYIDNYFIKLRAERSAANLEESRAFMEKNKNKKDVLTTESGLQYKIIKEGTGNSPKAKDMVRCKYHSTRIDGTVYQSTYEDGEAAELTLIKLIPGWSEGLQLMQEGGKYTFYIPAELAFGQRVPSGGVIEPNMALIIDVELIEVIMVGVKK